MTVPPAILSAMILSSIHFAFICTIHLYIKKKWIVLSLLVTFGVMVCNAAQAHQDPEGHTKNVEIAAAVVAGLAILNISGILYDVVKKRTNNDKEVYARCLVVLYFILTIVAICGHVHRISDMKKQDMNESN